ncbi:MAG: protease HtpX [Parachlamydiales bacterium]|nr:protease HtpX [Parachlamydiales bacterium]
MGFIKRILIFLVVNLLVVFTIVFLLSFFNIQPYLNSHGLNIQALAIFCLMWGFLGAFVSLLISRKMAKWMMKIQVIDENVNDDNLRSIYYLVKNISIDAGLKHIPQVGIYNSDEINAFATGPSQKRSLVALSTGLINKMKKDEIEGVLGHEISHIQNGDMITMTLLQGIVNAFVMFLARILAFFISSSRDKKTSYGSMRMFTFLFEVIFIILGSIVLAFYSRKREFKADAGSSKIVGKNKMISALKALKTQVDNKTVVKELKPAYQSFKISNNFTKKGLLKIFSTHPDLDARIEKLQNL